jgi:hypothetical protein
VLQSSVEASQIKQQDSSPWSRPFPMEGAPASVTLGAPTLTGERLAGDGMARGSVARELPDVTGFLVVVLVTLGLFVVPVGATLMQGPAIVASLFSR